MGLGKLFAIAFGGKVAGEAAQRVDGLPSGIVTFLIVGGIIAIVVSLVLILRHVFKHS